MPRATQAKPSAKKACKYGARVDGKCPPKPAADKKASARPCKYGARVDGKCPTKPASAKPASAKPASAPKAPRKHILRDSIHGLKGPEILRLARKAGIVMLSGLMYEEIRGVIKVLMEKIIKDAVILAEYAGRKTVLTKDVLAALEKNGLKMYWTDQKKITKCALSKKKDILGTIRHVQKQSECVYFGLAPFRRLVKEIAGDFMSSIRIGTEACNAIQIAIEEYTVALLKDAQLQAIHGKRKTVQPKNIQMTRYIRKERN